MIRDDHTASVNRKPFVKNDGIDLSPYIAPQTVEISDKTYKTLNQNLRNDLKSYLLSDVSTFFWLISLAGVAGALFMAPPLIMLTMCVSLFSLAFSVKDAVSSYMNGALKGSYNSLKAAFNKCQIDKITETQRALIKTADQKLTTGKLLSPETMSLLADAKPESLDDASAQLAITVHQIRQALRFSRYANGKIEGDTPALPMTFKRAALQADSDFSRRALLDCLKKTCEKITEDNEPKLASVEIEMPKKNIKGSLTSRFMRALFIFAPAFYIRDRIVISKTTLPRIPATNIPGLQPVADCMDAIKHYESSPEGKQYPLDLPAMRGWS